MANPTIYVYSADGTKQELSTSNPLAVQTVTEAETATVTLAFATGTVAAAGQTQLIAAPGAGLQIVINSFQIQNESATATTMRLDAGAVPFWRALMQNQGDGVAGSLGAGREWELPANTALNLWLSGANSHGYSLAYYIK